MSRPFITEVLKTGVPAVTTALGALYAYDKHNSLKWGFAGGLIGWCAGYAFRSLVLRLAERDQALPKEVAPSLPPAALPAKSDQVRPLNLVKPVQDEEAKEGSQ
jgi:hypothetical protein